MSERKLTRRDFLKLMGAGAAVGLAWRFLDPLSKPTQRFEASAQSQGSWSLGPRATITPIHMVMLSTGKLLYLAGSGYHEYNRGNGANLQGLFQAQLVDPSTGDNIQYTFPDDFFCIGHNHLSNGNILLTGGTRAYDVDNPDGLFEGGPFVYEFDVHTSTFTKLQNMRHGRWYPTQIIMANGRVVIVGGLDEYGDLNDLVEVYDPASRTTSIMFDPTPNRDINGNPQANGQGQWCVGATSSIVHQAVCYGNATNQGNAPPISLYPRMHLMPSGLIATVGSGDEVYLLNPNTGHWARVGFTGMAFRDYGSSFLLPLQNTAAERGSVLIAGGALDGITPATATCELIDFNSGTNTAPVIRSTSSMNFQRHYPIPVTLPDGKLVMFAGTTGVVNINFILEPEMYDPQTETWTTLPPAVAGRTYHGVGVVLPDGRVFIASSSPDRLNWETRTEIFSPWYYFEERPTINGNVSTAPYGGTIRIPTPDAANITAVSLLRLNASTHHFEPNMRLIWLPIINREQSGVLVSAPINGNIAPPGPYYIHVLNSNGVPSAGKVINIPGILC